MLHSATPHLLLIKADFDPINNAVQLKDAQNLGSMPVTSLLAKVELIPIIKESSREKRSYDRVTTLKSALDQAYVLNNIQRFKDTQSQHTTIQPSNHTAVGWAKLPVELKCRIIHYAMTAKDGNIMLPCLTDREYKPRLALDALRVNYFFYVEARSQLYGGNAVLCDNFGTDLIKISNNIGRSNFSDPIFGYLNLTVGDCQSETLGEVKAQSFTSMLRGLSPNIKAFTLSIHLRRFSFMDAVQVKTFAGAVANIQIKSELGLRACTKHLQFGLSEINMALGVGLEPIRRADPPAGSGEDGEFVGFYPLKTADKRTNEQPEAAENTL